MLIITNDRKSLLNFVSINLYMAKNLKKIVVGVVLDVISWGKQKGNHLFKCKNCGIYFTSENNLLD